jgi:hypothetical protein
MRRRSEVLIFIASAIAYSVLLSALIWMLPKGRFNPSNSFIVVPAVSVMLSARAVPWRRRLGYASATLGTFLVVDFIFASSGLAARVWPALGVELGASAMAVVYMAFSMGFPLGALLFFVGRDPSILWSGPASDKPVTPAKTHRQR